MILLVSVIAGLAATLLRARWTGRTLKPLDIRFGWLVYVAVIPQLLMFEVRATAAILPDSLVPVILPLSMTALLVFAGINLRQPGFWALGLGLLGNFLAILSNGGWMPTSPDALFRMMPALPIETWQIGERLGFSKDKIMPVGDIHLGWLSDCLTLPVWVPYKVVFSAGDIFIALGAFLLIWSLSRPGQENSL